MATTTRKKAATTKKNQDNEKVLISEEEVIVESSSPVEQSAEKQKFAVTTEVPASSAESTVEEESELTLEPLPELEGDKDSVIAYSSDMKDNRICLIESKEIHGMGIARSMVSELRYRNSINGGNGTVNYDSSDPEQYVVMGQNIHYGGSDDFTYSLRCSFSKKDNILKVEMFSSDKMNISPYKVVTGIFDACRIKSDINFNNYKLKEVWKTAYQTYLESEFTEDLISSLCTTISFIKEDKLHWGEPRQAQLKELKEEIQDILFCVRDGNMPKPKSWILLNEKFNRLYPVYNNNNNSKK